MSDSALPPKAHAIRLLVILVGCGLVGLFDAVFRAKVGDILYLAAVAVIIAASSWLGLKAGQLVTRQARESTRERS